MKERLLSIISLGGSFLIIILVLVLTYFATRWYARRIGPSAGGRYVKIIDRSVISNGSALVIAKIEERYYLLGISEKNVGLLCELPDFKEETSPQAPPVPFSKMMRDMLDKYKASPDKSAPKDDGGPQ